MHHPPACPVVPARRSRPWPRFGGALLLVACASSWGCASAARGLGEDLAALRNLPDSARVGRHNENCILGALRRAPREFGFTPDLGHSIRAGAAADLGALVNTDRGAPGTMGTARVIPVAQR